MLDIGTKAPDFALPDQDGKIHKLSDYRGKKVILYFYPKDNTPGCTKQACGFSERFSEFEKKGAIVLGISKDTVESHKKFQQKFSLTFPILSDSQLSAIKQYDTWKLKKFMGRENMGILRTTYLIDENGIIIFGSDKVKAADNPQEMIELI